MSIHPAGWFVCSKCGYTAPLPSRLGVRCTMPDPLEPNGQCSGTLVPAYVRPPGDVRPSAPPERAVAHPVSLPPVFEAVGTVQGTEGVAILLTIVATSPGGYAITYTLGSGAPAGATIGATDGHFSWTPPGASAGTYTISVSATDAGTPPLSSTIAFAIAVAAVAPGANRPPVIQPIANLAVIEGQTATTTAQATDPDGDSIAFALAAGAPAGAGIGSASGVFSWPTPAGSGGSSFPITVTATDSGTPPLTASTGFAIAVAVASRAAGVPVAGGFAAGAVAAGTGGVGTVPPPAANRPPVIQPIGARSVAVGSPLTIQVVATDPDGDALSFALGAGAPAGAAISGTGLFAWTPQAANQGNSYPITVIVTDDGTPPLSAQATFTVAVVAAIGPGAGPVAVAALIPKSGTMIGFGVYSTAPPAIAGGSPELAAIRTVTATPTVRVNGVPVSVGPPIWNSTQLDWPFVFLRLNCGAVRNLAPAPAGSGYTAPVVTWNGDGGGTTLTFGTPTLDASGGIQWVPITATSHDFTSQPTVTVADSAGGTGSGAVLFAIMTGVQATDSVEYDAPANWVGGVLAGTMSWAQGVGNFWSGGTVQPIAAASAAPVDNWTGVTEGVSGPFACFAQAPVMLGGSNPGAQPSDVNQVTMTAGNRVRSTYGWTIASGGGVLSNDANGWPLSWTNPAAILGCTVSNVAATDQWGQNLPSQGGDWTVQYDDPNVVADPPNAAVVTLTGRVTVAPVSSTTSGITVTNVYHFSFGAQATVWQLNLVVNVRIPTGRWTLSNFRVIGPDNRDGSAQAFPPHGDDFVFCPNAVRAHAGAHAVRFLSQIQGFGGGPDANYILATDPVPPNRCGWAGGWTRFVRFQTARYFNTDPADAVHNWVSATQLVGPQPFFDTPLALPPADNGAAFGNSNNVVIEFLSNNPHGFQTGQYITCWPEGGGVGIPIIGGAAFRPASGMAGVLWVNGPNSVIAMVYNPGNVATSDACQRVNSATPIDLTAGGTYQGWNIQAKSPVHSVPYKYGSGPSRDMPGCAMWVNLACGASNDLVTAIGTDLCSVLGPTNTLILEFGNEIWSGGSSQAWLTPYGRLMGYVPAGTTILGGRFTGTGSRPGGYPAYAAAVPMCANMVDTIRAIGAPLGVDASRILATYGSMWVGPNYTDNVCSLLNRAAADAAHICVAPYYDIPNDPTMAAAMGVPANGGAGLPVEGINDVARYLMAYSKIWHTFWNQHHANIAKWALTPSPTLVCYEGGPEYFIPSGVTGYWQLQADCFAHPSGRDLIYGWYAAMQQGDPATPGTGAALACYFQTYNAFPYWFLAYGMAQPPGPGTNNRYMTPQGGYPADHKQHIAGNPGTANVSPALQGSLDWYAAVPATLSRSLGEGR